VTGGVLDAEAVVRREAGVLGTRAWPTSAVATEPFRVGFAGPARTGKSTLVRALLGEGSDALLRAPGRHRPTRAALAYRHGASLAVKVRATGDDHWLTAAALTWPVDVADALGRIASGYDEGAVELPLPLLAHWNVELVDLPPFGVTEALDAIARAHVARCDALVWLVHPRGLGDAELLELERLRDVPTAFVQSVRDDQLTPTSLPVQVAEVPIGDAAFPHAFPVVAPECARETRERAVVVGLLNALRRAHLNSRAPDALRTLAQGAAELRAAAAEAAERRLAAVKRRVRDAPDALRRIEALRALQTLEVHVREGILPGQERVRGAQALLDALHRAPAEDAYDALVGEGERLAAEYNVRAGARVPAAPATDPAGPLVFGERFVKPRTDLQRLLRNVIGSADALMLGRDDLEALSTLAAEVRDGRVEIALLGIFSSGKSALVNSLLGVPIDDRDSELLPTRPTVTTATVNRLEWAERPQLNGVDWLDATELTFLAEDAVGVRVREQEILAFRRWLEAGSVRLDECEVEEFRPPAGARPLDRGSLVRALFSETLGPGGKCPNYHRASGTRLAGRVRIPRFHGDRPPLVAGMSHKQAFALAERPEVALQVAMLRIGFRHPLLEHGAIIDTPGTDAHVPHHRALSRSLVRRRRVPVIYCFLSTQPGGIEDRRNLEVLLECGEDTLRRVFFVITRKGEIREEERGELRTHVREQLAGLRMPVQALHFIELKDFADPEYDAFQRELTAFIQAEQLPQVAAWGRRAAAVMRQNADAAAARLAELDLADEERAAREKTYTSRLAALTALEAEARSSDAWGVAYVRRRVDAALAKQCAEIDTAIDGLRHRKDFAGLDAWLDRAVEDLDAKAGVAVRTATRAMRAKLHSRLAELNVDAPAEVALEERTWFDGSAAVTAAERVDFSAWEALWDGLSYANQVNRARASIARAWSPARATGIDACSVAAQAIAGEYRNHVSRAVERARRDLEAVRVTDRRAREALRARLRDGRRHAEAWHRRFLDWEKTHADESRDA
jgi:hypothetical protein